MKVFSILVATCLLGLCHCRRSRVPTDRLVIEVLDDYVEDEIMTTYLVEGVNRSGSSAWTGKRLVWDLSNGTVYEVEYTLPLALRYSDEKVEDMALFSEASSQEVDTQLADYARQPDFSPPKDPRTVDLACLKDPRYKVLDVDIAGAPARVYIVDHREDVKRVKYNGQMYG